MVSPHPTFPADVTPPPSGKISVSFCTTCANRLGQLQQTFAANAADMQRELDGARVIVNYGSKDSLHDFMLEKQATSPDRIVYAQELSGRPWHSSIAKNVARRIATGNILVNLD